MMEIPTVHYGRLLYDFPFLWCFLREKEGKKVLLSHLVSGLPVAAILQVFLNSSSPVP